MFLTRREKITESGWSYIGLDLMVVPGTRKVISTRFTLYFFCVGPDEIVGDRSSGCWLKPILEMLDVEKDA